jgi:hypothetical protein
VASDTYYFSIGSKTGDAVLACGVIGIWKGGAGRETKRGEEWGLGGIGCKAILIQYN